MRKSAREALNKGVIEKDPVLLKEAVILTNSISWNDRATASAMVAMI